MSNTTRPEWAKATGLLKDFFNEVRPHINGHITAMNKFHEAIAILESPIPQPLQGDAVDPDFTLWVVVNKWQYSENDHKWFNNYIGEFDGLHLKHLDLYTLFKNKQQPDLRTFRATVTHSGFNPGQQVSGEQEKESQLFLWTDIYNNFREYIINGAKKGAISDEEATDFISKLFNSYHLTPKKPLTDK